MEMYTMVFVLAGLLLGSGVIMSTWSVVSAFRGQIRVPRAVLITMFALAVGSAGLLGIEQASRAKFSLGQDGFSYFRTVEFDDLVKRNHLSPNTCRAEDGSPLCRLANLSGLEQPDYKIVVVQSDTTYRLRYGHWPNVTVVELPKSRITF